ncbi:MAG: glucokinase [Gemmatimonadaceae bacterium]|nr:glucokinase [Gemmatimonadaceae bacterium]
MKVLAGDVGGTHARLAVVEIDAREIAILEARTYRSREFPGLAPIVLDFLAAVGERCDRACFGIACPVVGGECETPNLPWSVNARRLAADIGIPGARLVNDLDAIAYGVARLGPADLVCLQAGERREHGVIALIGAGTGLGQAFLVWDGVRYRPCPSEGGHVTFAPRTDLERALQAALAAELGHVSFERVLSGPGLVNIYRFLAARDGARENPAVRDAIAAEGGKAVSRYGLRGEDPLCAAALDLFAGVYGAQAGNLALTVLATGGVYVVGGIAPAIVEKLSEGRFMSAFRDKGRMGALLEKIPVHVVMNPRVGLLGAAVAALEDDAVRADGAPCATRPTHPALGAR